MPALNRYVERNLKRYKATLRAVRAISLEEKTDTELLALGANLAERAKSGERTETLLPITFAAVIEATNRALSLRIHDAQILAGIAMASGRVIELSTGEGKTLSAVLVASLFALGGKGVHVLTFNDYLARRDAQWMRPIYARLGLSVASIDETSDASSRRVAYAADITYLTAKEAGFDYLREFLAFDKEDLVRRPFHFAIVDEADSILLDEARVPLVIAGDIVDRIEFGEKIKGTVAHFLADVDYVFDEYGESVAMTESGIDKMEKALRLEDLYDARHAETIAKINLMLRAEFLLKRDTDYIVRDGKVLLVDSFTGRVARGREWPDGLQAAVEEKEGLHPQVQGMVMNRITIRHFLGFYTELCGMSGTAASAAAEFFAFYDKIVTVIPPEKPCVRTDQPDSIYADKESKWNAVSEEIIRTHSTGRPVLVGTVSVSESEMLADRLRSQIPALSVLNAKNDDLEAEIIARAGTRDAVTISTNMAGRGVDIRLGGDDPEEGEKVFALGGLYVIGTNRHESRRIDNQLRGRAGRQGDPGESRFFISLQDDLLMKYRLSESLPDRFLADEKDGRIENQAVLRAILHTQKISEGQNVDAKITLEKYAALVEEQRVLIHQKRAEILEGTRRIDVLSKTDPEKDAALRRVVSEEEYIRAEKRIELYAMNLCWADHLTAVEAALDEVRMISKVGGNPLDLYSFKLVEAFDRLERHICETILGIYDKLDVSDGRIALEEAGVRGPTSTRTYMVNDGTELQNQINEFAVSVNPMSVPMYAIYLLADFCKKKRKNKAEGESADP